jgi:serine/threonine-protein kinase
MVAFAAWLKGVPPDPQGEADLAAFIRRYFDEGKAASKIDHPRLAREYTVGIGKGKLPGMNPVTEEFFFRVREFVEGASLSALLDANGRPENANAVDTAIGLLEAVQHLHQLGRIHGRLKAKNVFRTESGEVKVTDMLIPTNWAGYPRLWAGSSETLFSYLSPEEVDGAEPDYRSDIYSAGTVIFELLTGTLPFSGGSRWAVAKRILSEQPPTPSSICDKTKSALDPVILKALAKDPEQRHASAAEFSAALSEAVKALPQE